MNNSIRKIIPAVLTSAVLIILIYTGIYKCPLDFFLGIPCPMCGITRALKSAIRGDLGGAFYYHPLWTVLVLCAVLQALSLLKIISPSKKMTDICCAFLCFLLIICFILRHLNGSPVVRIHFDSSFLYRISVFLTSAFSISG